MAVSKAIVYLFSVLIPLALVYCQESSTEEVTYGPPPSTTIDPPSSTSGSPNSSPGSPNSTPTLPNTSRFPNIPGRPNFPGHPGVPSFPGRPNFPRAPNSNGPPSFSEPPSFSGSPNFPGQHHHRGSRSPSSEYPEHHDGDQGHQDRLFFTLFSQLTSCNFTTEAGRTCRSCNQGLTCLQGNVGFLNNCVGLFKYCNAGRCSMTPGSACTTTTSTSSSTSASTAATG